MVSLFCRCFQNNAFEFITDCLAEMHLDLFSIAVAVGSSSSGSNQIKMIPCKNMLRTDQFLADSYNLSQSISLLFHESKFSSRTASVGPLAKLWNHVSLARRVFFICFSLF